MPKGGSAPATPDYAALLPLQEATNMRQYNRVIGSQRINQVNPYGSTRWIPPAGFSYNPPIPQVQSPLGPPTSAGGDGQGSAVGGGNSPPPPPTGAGASDLVRALAAKGPGTTTGDGTHVPGAGAQLPQPPVREGEYGPRFGTGSGSGTDGWTQITELSPEQQKLFEQQQRSQLALGNTGERLLGTIGDTYKNPLTTEGLPGGGVFAPGDSTSRSNAVAQALYDKSMRFAEPQFAKDTSNLRQSLIDRGFAEGSAGYDDELRKLGETQGQLRADARDRAILASGAEDSRLFGQDLSTYGTNLGARNQLFGERQTLRNEPLSAFNALTRGTSIQVPNLSGQANTPGVPGLDMLGAANQTYQGQLGAWNADQAAGQNAFGNLASLAALYMLMPSDARLKTEVVPVARTAAGRQLYSWKWHDGSAGFGVLAHENPDLTSEGANGFLQVDYSRLD